MDVEHIRSVHKCFSLQQKQGKVFKATTSCYSNNVIHIIMYITIINIVDVMRIILFVIIFYRQTVTKYIHQLCLFSI